MPPCFFATDLHGNADRYDKLLSSIIDERPAAVFLGGDLLPRSSLSAIEFGQPDFIHDYLVPRFTKTRDALGKDYPRIFLILGNDDPRCEEQRFVSAADAIWHYVHQQKCWLEDNPIYGFAYVPPTPFRLKDWERYDVSRFVPHGSVSPEEGIRTVSIENSQVKWGTIKKDLALLVGKDSLDHATFLFHTPPYDTSLDRAALDGKIYEDVALDVHVGSIAVKQFIEERQPMLTLHGHVHEAARLTGEWKIHIGRTVCINGAHDGPELALVRFDLKSPANATRELL